MRVCFRPAALALCAAIAASAACAGPARDLVPGLSAADGVALHSTGLLYVSDLGANSVDYFTYPAGKLVGKLTGFGSVAGLCSNKSGDVFVVDEAGPVVVYSHGGSTPVRKLQTTGAPYGCAVDRGSGDLALTNLSSLLYGTIAIYPKAKGKPKTYNDNEVSSTDFCAYDGKGNLFVDGTNRFAEPVLLELPKAGRAFRTHRLAPTFQGLGGVQWDGADVAIADRGAGLIYRMSSDGKVVQTVRLKGGANVDGFWIAGSTLVGPNAASAGTVPFWRYPHGGVPAKALRKFSYPIAVTISASAAQMPVSAGSARSSHT